MGLQNGRRLRGCFERIPTHGRELQNIGRESGCFGMRERALPHCMVVWDCRIMEERTREGLLIRRMSSHYMSGLHNA